MPKAVRGDRLDLAAMRCIPVDTPLCATALGQQDLVVDQRRGELILASTSKTPARHIAFVAEAPPFNAWAAAFLPLDQIAAIAVIMAAAWLVWTRPGGTTCGFFLYLIWFNPGLSYQYYALPQTAPTALLLHRRLRRAGRRLCRFQALQEAGKPPTRDVRTSQSWRSPLSRPGTSPRAGNRLNAPRRPARRT